MRFVFKSTQSTGDFNEWWLFDDNDDEMMILIMMHNKRKVTIDTWPRPSSCYCMTSCFSCAWLYDLMDCSPPGSSVPGILQTRILVWIALPFPRGSSRPGDWTRISCVSFIASGFFIHRATWELPLVINIKLIWTTHWHREETGKILVMGN